MKREEKRLDREKQAETSVEMNGEVLQDIKDDSNSLADVAMKHFLERQKSVKTKYMDVRFMCSSSNKCERLFCEATRVYSDLKKQQPHTK